MTKIDELLSGQVGQPGQTPKPGSKTNGDFAKLLDEALGLEGQSTAKISAPTQTVPGLESVTPPAKAAAPDAAQGLTPLQQEGMERAERTVALLEQYAERLGQADLSLKEVQPSLTALEKEARGLAEVADRLEPDDNLHGIVQEVLMRVAAESVKFNRGDYLTT
jgi:hypothetical protein